MFLLARDHVARAHRSILMPPTFAYPDATLHCVGKTSFVTRIFEIRLPLRRIVMLAVTQIFVAPVRANDFTWVHFPVRVQISLNSRKVCISSSPNIFGNNSPRDWPSPCSPESEPP